jgi:hypothetical protein
MEAPKCKVCKERHGLGEPHIWRDEPKAKAKPVDKPVNTVTNRPDTSVDKPVHKTVDTDKSDAERVRRWRKTHPEAYRSYMRDYMRRIRAGTSSSIV